MSTMDRVRVELEERSYDILAGPELLQQAGQHLAPLLKQPRVMIVSDDNVAPLHLATLEESLSKAAITHSHTILPHGERTKDFAHLERLVEQLLEDKVERTTTLIALGGGVIGDITGFAASVVLRGVDFVQAPTTLLSQVDSSVGGKTGINSPHGKNLIGSFYQPRMVLADINTLDTLPQRELLAGYAETVKYGLINDPDFFSWLEENGAVLCAGDPALRQQAVVTSCRAKAAIVAADEKESGPRALLNLGHTFAHALEAEAGYGDTLIHGEAVALGIQFAFDLSVRLKHCPQEDSERVAHHFEAVGLPTNLSHIAGPHWTPQTLLAHMAHDKKVHEGKITFVLTRGIGQAFLTAEVDMKELESTLSDALSR
ncbi:MAG: 3-dehydroquinate synthase [Alphaproteobacteria bacterium]|nr:3-dehydroquinate synthase [Alphaproteobacteria bacterium]